MIRTDTLGNTTWIRHLGGSLAQVGNSFVQPRFYDMDHPSDAIIVVGYSQIIHPVYPYLARSIVYIFKLSGSGARLWEKTYDATNYGTSSFNFEEGRSIFATLDTGFIVISRAVNGNLMFDYVLKIDPSGNLQNAKIYDTQNLTDDGFSIIETEDSNYLFTGNVKTATPNTPCEVSLVKIGNNLNIIWGYGYYIRDLENYGYSVVEDTVNNDYVVAGETIDSRIQIKSPFLFKTDSVGVPVWANVYYDFFDSTYSGHWLHSMKQADTGYVMNCRKDTVLTVIHTDEIGAVATACYDSVEIYKDTLDLIYDDSTTVVVNHDTDEPLYWEADSVNPDIIPCDSVERDPEGKRNSNEFDIKTDNRDSKEDFYIYPNILYDQNEINLHYKSTEFKEVIHVEIFDMFGKLVHSSYYSCKEGVNKHTINLSSLSPGVYYLTANANNKLPGKRVIIVN